MDANCQTFILLLMISVNILAKLELVLLMFLPCYVPVFSSAILFQHAISQKYRLSKPLFSVCRISWRS